MSEVTAEVIDHEEIYLCTMDGDFPLAIDAEEGDVVWCQDNYGDGIKYIRADIHQAALDAANELNKSLSLNIGKMSKLLDSEGKAKNQLRAKVQRLEGYAQHSSTCGKWDYCNETSSEFISDTFECCCGLTEALSEQEVSDDTAYG
jgi:hypothetical protein